jgi:hypothetical protein
MSEFSGSAIMGRESGQDPAEGPAQSNAVLFYQLARFVVWGQQHRNLLASDHELQDLLCDAAAALANTGVAVPRGNL